MPDIARSPLGLHLPDADRLTGAEITAALDLSPSAFLVLVYSMWDADKGVAQQITDLVHSLGHDRLYVRFHADPHPPGYAKKIGGPEAWGRLCAQRMTQYYQPLADAGVQLHAILANETDADYEGGLSVAKASDFHRRSMAEYAAKRPGDILHVPAPTGAPQAHREHLERYQADGWIEPGYWIDGHGYGGDLENVLNTIREVVPGHEYVITETNNLDEFAWPEALLAEGRARDIVYFILNWARGGEGRVLPPTPDDAEKRMSLLRFPARYAQFKATVREQDADPAPIPDEPPSEPPEPESTPYAIPGRIPSYEDVRDAAIRIADESGQPRRRVLGLCLGESGHGLQSFDRWASTERSRRMVAAIDARDWPLADAIFGEIAGTPTNDISFGPAHQSWYWSDGYPGDRKPGDPYRHDLGEIMKFRARLIEDHEWAIRKAAGALRGLAVRFGREDDQFLLERYNKPNAEVSAGVRKNYADALAVADAILAELAVPTPQPEPAPEPAPAPGGPMPDYHFGFKAIADTLGREAVGDPLTDEQPFRAEDLTVQYTSRGLMIYHKPTNTPLFFEAQRA